MDSETKTMLQEIRAGLNDVKTIKGAVAQLEEQVKGVPQTVERKLAAVRQQMYEPSGRYRGVFSSDDQARSFGVLVLSATKEHRDRMREIAKTDYSDLEQRAFTSTDAGVLIPEEFASRLLDMLEVFGVFERSASRFPMTTDVQRYPKKTARTTAVPMGEGTSIAETKPTISDKALTARKWGVFLTTPTEVVEDALAAIGEMLARDIAMAHAQALDDAGFNGDGTATYNQITGILNALIAEAIVTGSGSTWSALTLEDFEKTVAIPVSTALTDDAAFYCSRQFFFTVMVKLMLSAGGVTAAEIQGRREPVFMGYPVRFAQVLATASAASTISCVFGNLRMGATFGDRRVLRVAQSEHFKFSEDLLSILGTRRYDVQIDGAGEGTTPEVISALQTAA